MTISNPNMNHPQNMNALDSLPLLPVNKMTHFTQKTTDSTMVEKSRIVSMYVTATQPCSSKMPHNASTRK